MKNLRSRLAALVAVLAIALLLCGLSLNSQDQISPDILSYSHHDLKLYALRTFGKLTRGAHPAWEDESRRWRDQCDVELVPEGCEPLKATASPLLHFRHSLEMAPQSLLLSSTPSQAEINGAFPRVLQTVYYNDSASKTIERHKLGNRDHLKSRLESLSSNTVSLFDMSVQDFDQDAVVVKTFWEIVYGVRAGREHYARGASLFHKDLKFEDPETGRYPQFGHWTSPPTVQTEMRIDLDKRMSCISSTDEQRHPVYSLGCFHYRQVREEDLAQIPNHLVTHDDIKGPQCHGECYLILLGVHIMTRDTPNWVWMTFWWSNEWWDDPHHLPTVSDKWSLFEADATVNNTDSVANPYLEGTTSGMYSNCLECHRHAVFHPGYGSGFNTLSTACSGTQVSRYVTGVAGADVCHPLHFEGYPPVLQSRIPAVLRDLQAPPCYFDGALQTHFLWTVALNSDIIPPDQPQDPCLESGGTPTAKQPIGPRRCQASTFCRAAHFIGTKVNTRTSFLVRCAHAE
jgi:hypothetical protein